MQTGTALRRAPATLRAKLAPESHRAARACTGGSRKEWGIADPRAEALDAVRVRVHRRVITELGPVFYNNLVDQKELRSRVERIVQAALRTEKTPMSAAEAAQVAQSVTDDVLGYGPIERLLNDPTISEIMVNGPDKVYIERNGKIIPTKVSFLDEAHLRHVTGRIVAEVGRHIDESSPMVDARLLDGLSCQRHLPATGRGWSVPDHPEIRHRSLHSAGPDWVRHLHPTSGRAARGVRGREGQRPGVRRGKHRQDDPAQRAVVFHPHRRAHHHHRRCQGVAVTATPRGRPGVPAAQHRG